MEGITKVYPGAVANDRITLDVAPGEIHALLGENGAGKTTLMNILCGLTRPDAGRILLDGWEVEIRSPRDAMTLGIGVVHQQLMLVPTFSVVQNVALGLPRPWSPFVDLGALAEDIATAAQRFGMRLDPGALVETLPLGTRQKVEILKALYRGARVLVLDEPTAVLVPQEVSELFSTLRALAASGASVVFITHKLDEVMTVSDRVTILRGGRRVETLVTSETTAQDLAERMVGRKIGAAVRKPERPAGGPILEVERLTVALPSGRTALDDVTFSVQAGEILGVAGVDGNGQRELMEILFGLRRPSAGTVRINGREAAGLRPRDLIAAGVGRIPEDRHDMGLVLEMTVSENLLLERFHLPPFSRRGLLSRRLVRRAAEELTRSYDIRPPVPDLPVKSLSGGNQQKVILARVLAGEPSLLVAVNPTRGLDVGATEFVHQALLRCRENGSAILFISSELPEVLALADRIAVLFEGRVQALVAGEEADPLRLGLWMTGAARLASARAER